MSDSINPHRFYSVRDAAELIGLPAKQVRRLCREGAIRSRNNGRAYAIPGSALVEYLSGADEPMQHPDSLRRSA